ncbi:acyltransferase family protein [Methylococcus capsulatus]|uniref:acyltransferase family protein n=1 Tax=Methylococcus capsulatus TaxID=414 RepID=UPI00211B2D56|nr:acyltransferase [Methylococcus capsulatus]
MQQRFGYSDRQNVCKTPDCHVYFPWFDWLRITLATTVLLYHEGLLAWSRVGNFSVQVFFALSGWLIGWILLNTEKKDIPHFYFNRAIRIWLPYFLTLILLVSASILHDKITPKWWEFVIYKSLFVYNWFGTRQLDTFLQEMPLQGTGNHFWSINTEEQFYLFAPIPLVLVNKRFGQNLLIWVAIALIAWLTKDYASIALGVLAAVAVKQYGNFHETTKARVILFITAIASMVTMLLNDNLYAKVAPFCAVSIVLLLSIRGEKNHLGKFMGGISYPLYLNAWIGGFIANAFAKHIIAVTPNVKHGIAILLSFLIASTLYWFIERPMLNMRAKLYSGRLAKLVVLVGYLSIFAGIGFGLSHFS